MKCLLWAVFHTKNSNVRTTCARGGLFICISSCSAFYFFTMAQWRLCFFSLMKRLLRAVLPESTMISLGKLLDYTRTHTHAHTCTHFTIHQVFDCLYRQLFCLGNRLHSSTEYIALSFVCKLDFSPSLQNRIFHRSSACKQARPCILLSLFLQI